ncbi:DNA photolyase [Artomyces pyxidatus]|uniref:DNA photolyase n=1 Tax=Artomyces pyxidatus TaxID=48021 RepID=A0ACB8T5L5_9AGAM|nr:DNA photolyase [Artomyces pyxidatus]
MSPPAPRVICWFRTDLRVHDSPALHAALALAPACLYPVWCWDPHYVRTAPVAPNRWRFLLECQRDLSAALTRLNPAQRLFVLREAPTTLLPKLFAAWNITHLVFERDTDTSYGALRDAEIVEKARNAGVQVVTAAGRTLWDPVDITREAGGKPTMSLTAFMKAAKKLGDPAKPLDAPTSLPDPGDLTLSFEHAPPSSDTDINAPHRRGHGDQSYVALAGPGGDFSVPTLEELGIPASAATTPHQGGETIALQHLAKLIADPKYIATFEKPKTAPTAFEPASTTLLSPHLHFGSLSVRRFLHDVQNATAKHTGKKSSPPTNLPGQLYFRDMYFAAQHAVGPAFGCELGNPVVRYIPWHLPSTDTGYTVDSLEAHAWFVRWAWGLTGFPFVDALMRQLRAEGWIHHLGRHMAACFLTRGGAYVHWERGAAVFAELLLDHEPACNAGNWMWLSCTAFFAQYYRVYSPVAFGKKWDPEGTFIRRYVPELAEYSNKWIYEPHRAPREEQRKAGCVVRALEEGGKNSGDVYYPAPMFDFAERREVCLAGMKEAYKVGVHGDDARVVNGTARDALFGNEHGAASVETGTAGEKRKRAGSTLDGWVQKKTCT